MTWGFARQPSHGDKRASRVRQGGEQLETIAPDIAGACGVALVERTNHLVFLNEDERAVRQDVQALSLATLADLGPTARKFRRGGTGVVDEIERKTGRGSACVVPIESDDQVQL